jgi:carbamoyltransferase
MTTVLGVYLAHDLSACLLRDGEIVCHIEEERLTRVKHGTPVSVRGLWKTFHGKFGYFPWASVRHCLEAAGIGLEEVDVIALPEGATSRAAASLLPVRGDQKIYYSEEPAGGVHHYRHALSTFFGSSFESAAVLVTDGDGSFNADGHEAESGYHFHGRDGRYTDVFKNRYKLTPLADGTAVMGGLGWTYENVSAILGFVDTHFGDMADPGKTMGLAPYGRPGALPEPAWIRSDGFRLDFSRFFAWLESSGLSRLIKFDDRSRALIQNERDVPQYAADLAWRVLHELERAVLELAGRLHDATGERNLCLAGGVALNSVANGLIVARGPFEQVFIQPAAADNGQAIGIAYQAHLALGGGRTIAPIRHAFGGRAYGDEEIRALLDDCELDHEELPGDEALAQSAAARLDAGAIVGWFQGGSEYGPRALGHRSILADPRPAAMKNRLNYRVKFREPFRPFAPSVLAERASEVFELRGPAPYMLVVAPVREAWRARVPAITHVDGTARVQTVDRAVDPRYHALISAFAARTGVPLVLNTSFNLRGMPIVETPRDALQCFLYTEMDVLYLGRFEVVMPPAGKLCPALAKGWTVRVDQTHAGARTTTRARFWNEAERKEVALPDDPRVWKMCSTLDGRRTLREAVAWSGQEGAEGSEDRRRAEELVRRALRAGALALKLGKLLV